jgi:hypothetical protein
MCKPLSHFISCSNISRERRSKLLTVTEESQEKTKFVYQRCRVAGAITRLWVTESAFFCWQNGAGFSLAILSLCGAHSLSSGAEGSGRQELCLCEKASPLHFLYVLYG